MDAVYRMAEHAVALRYEALPSEAIEATKKDILDTLGTMVAGSSAPGCKELIRTLLETYTDPRASILVHGCKVPCPEAALANATMGHALDFDDTHDRAFLHAGVSVIPASIALAEQMGGASGKDLITVVTLGIDWVCRMGLATRVAPIASGWIYTATYGFFGAAASAGKLLGLDVEQMVNAMGIAYAQAAGNMQCIRDGALTKRMQPGFAARGGLLSALLAKNGMTGARNVFEGEAGLHHVYLKDAYDPEPLVSELGTRFEGVNLSFKPYPCCRYTHTAIDATLRLAHDNQIDSDEIEEITVGVDQQTYKNVCMPLELRRRPRAVVDAQFSIPYCIATAAVKKAVFIDDFTEREIRNSRVLMTAQKVTPVIDPAIEEKYSQQMSAAVVTIKTKTGKTFSERRRYPSGGPENPMSFDELVLKFRKCAAYGEKPLASHKIDAVVDMIENLESVGDVRDLVKLFV